MMKVLILGFRQIFMIAPYFTIAAEVAIVAAIANTPYSVSLSIVPVTIGSTVSTKSKKSDIGRDSGKRKAAGRRVDVPSTLKLYVMN